jgi:hypothetical protein
VIKAIIHLLISIMELIPLCLRSLSFKIIHSILFYFIQFHSAKLWWPFSSLKRLRCLFILWDLTASSVVKGGPLILLNRYLSVSFPRHVPSLVQDGDSFLDSVHADRWPFFKLQQVIIHTFFQLPGGGIDIYLRLQICLIILFDNTIRLHTMTIC